LVRQGGDGDQHREGLVSVGEASLAGGVGHAAEEGGFAGARVAQDDEALGGGERSGEVLAFGSAVLPELID